MRLSRAALKRVPPHIPAPPGRAPLGTGIVHFGPGAFHRAHQADFIDRLLNHDPRWGIAAVSLRSAETVAALAEQDGLYTLAIEDQVPSLRVIGAHTAFLGPSDSGAVHALLADPRVALVTATVTEKGYCLAADGTLDLTHPDIAADLTGGPVPRSLTGWLVAGLAARRAAGLAPFVAMPCDNLADNGRKLHAALIAFARVRDAALADWIAGEVRVPGTMVDAITPASDESLYASVAATLGLTDRAAVRREAFAQWVIEDIGQIGPDLAAVGATVTGDVGGFERAKLRILNGAHSTLAYLGLLRGHTTVAGAMEDAPLAAFVTATIAEEIVPVLGAVPGLDVVGYAAAILDRFRNPAIAHRLDQIAQDGSQKLSYRLGDTLLAHRAAGTPAPASLMTAYAAWAVFVWRRARAGVPVIDPLAARLTALANGTDPAGLAAALAAERIGFPLSPDDDPATVRAFADAARQLSDSDGSTLDR